MLLDGFNHVAIITADRERFVAFYGEVFDAKVIGEQHMGDEGVLTFVEIGDQREINLFEVTGNTEASKQTPMFGRGRLDHLGLQAASLDAFEEIRERLIARGAATSSSPTSVRCSRCSSPTRTGSKAKSASRTPTPCPASSTRPARELPATPAEGDSLRLDAGAARSSRPGPRAAAGRANAESTRERGRSARSSAGSRSAPPPTGTASARRAGRDRRAVP